MNEPDNDILKQFGFGDDENLRKTLSELEHLKVKPALSKDEAWAKFEQAVVAKGAVKRKSNQVTFGTVLKIAASILLLMAVWMVFNAWNNTEYITANSQTKEIVLPDNSIVTLNAASKINYKKFRWKASRKVELFGEALFKVTKGGNFKVSSLGKTIRVLGTQFNVFSRENYFEVKCMSGKVEVQMTDKTKILLTQGKAVRKDKDKVPTKYDVINNGTTWINGNFYYNDADLNLVFDEIARQYNVYISKNALDRRYTGYFNRSDLKEALDHVCLPMGLSYSIIKDTVIIKKGF